MKNKSIIWNSGLLSWILFVAAPFHDIHQKRSTNDQNAKKRITEHIWRLTSVHPLHHRLVVFAHENRQKDDLKLQEPAPSSASLLGPPQKVPLKMDRPPPGWWTTSRCSKQDGKLKAHPFHSSGYGCPWLVAHECAVGFRHQTVKRN
jgi:hypothetical protein